MPVPMPRGGNNRAEYVVVRRTGPEGKEVVNKVRIAEPADSTLEVTAPTLPRHVQTRDDDDDDLFEHLGDDDEDNIPPAATVTIIRTMTQAQATALANSDPSTTAAVSLTPSPRPDRPHHPKGISQTTHHLLIAAGSIGVTIIVVMIILALHTMRKRGMTLPEAIRYGRYHVIRRGPPPPPPKSWSSKQAYGTDYGAMRNGTVTPPPRAMSIDRSGSISSQRPLMALQRSESFNNRPVTKDRAASPDAQRSFLLDSPARSNSHRRNNSNAPITPVLPQHQQQGISPHDIRFMSEDPDPRFPEPPVDRTLSPLPPPPSFKQFLNNRPSASNRPGLGAMVSRFSWTNSNAPQTPHDPNRDTGAYMVGRDSFMTQRSSVPRFRTVDSWVNQQANRIEVQKLKEQYRLTQSTQYSEEGGNDQDTIPKVPQLPNTMSASASASGPSSVPAPIDTATPMPTTAGKPTSTPPPPPSGGLPGKNIKHERHDTRTTVETAPIFRQHPGTEVRFSSRSAVPSEILDMGCKTTVLS